MRVGEVKRNRGIAIIVGTAHIALALLVTSCGGGANANLAGNGAVAAPSLAPASLAFASQAVGTATTAQMITLTNAGNADLSLTSVAVSGANAGDFTQSNNCGSSIAAGAKCAISVTFKPAASGTRTAAVTLSDDATGSPNSVALSGTIATTNVSVSPSSLALGSQPLSTASAVRAITLSNTGKGTLNVTGVAVSGVNASDFTQSNNCGSSVASGAKCTINVTFKPAAAGTRTASVVVADTAANSPQSVALSGTGDAPVASVSPSSVAFGNQAVGVASSAQAVTLTNSGNAALSVTSIAVFGVNASDFAQSNNCGTSVAAGATCTISVTFKPTVGGSLSAAIAITDNAAGSPQSVSLSGTGVSTGIVVSPSSVAFGNQSVGVTSSSHAVTLTNAGSSALSITSIAVFGVNAGDFAQSNNCGSSVAAGAKCTINVTFKPSAAGSRSAAVAITDNATGSPQSASLSGTGVSTGVTVSPSSVAFGNQSVGTTSSAHAVTLTNAGSSALSLTGIAVFGVNASDFAQTNNCGSSVAAGANCTINVTFTPSVSGSRAANIAITDNATGSPQAVSLSGTGASTTSGVSFSPSNLGFSNQPVEMTSTAQTITLTNSGAASLSITGFNVTGANSSEFAQNNNCGSSVAAGANCTIVVLFTPSATGARSAALSVSDNATGSPQSVSLSGTGSHDVILTWTASPASNISGYYIYRGTSSGGESATPLNSTPVNVTDFTDENVTAGTAYFYRVTAVTSDGVTQSAVSSEATATVPST